MSQHGMGKLRIIDDGIRFESEAEFLKTLYTSKIKSLEGKLHLESERGITMEARNDNGDLTNKLFIGNETVEAVTKSFEVKDTKGQRRFRVTEDVIEFNSEEIAFTGNTSAVFEVAVKTPTLKGPKNQPLSISSETKLNIFGRDGIDITAPNGKLHLESDNDVILQSNDNSIYLDSKNIYIKQPKIEIPGTGTPYTGRIYQLCMCQSGKLFLSNQDCVASDQTC
ncbi:hypothetical protein KUTeg_024049 [Tegillarca granosa]|uniref:Beta-sarcoglycan n=1 Tax=Tegillarca granosa TaxID=220873 RepID=A0ABQ9DW79_TEGGR|nr:hypothetical protein KUTeg_024049 [Tegillarca granosa]